MLIVNLLISLKKLIKNIYSELPIICAFYSHFSIIISNFSFMLELCLLVSPPIKKNSDISFYYTCQFFDRAIYLKIQIDKKFLIDAQRVIWRQ